MRKYVYQQKRMKNGKPWKSKTYTGVYMFDGDLKETRVSLKTTDKRIAEKRLDEIVALEERRRAGLLLPLALTTAASKPLHEHLADFVADLKSTGREKEYYRHIQSRNSRMLKEFGWQTVSEINADQFVAWRNRLEGKPRTKNHFLDALSAFCNWLLAQRRIETNPVEHVRRVSCPRGTKGNHRSFTPDEITRLIEAAPERAAVYLLAIITGLRKAELRRLRWEHVHLTDPPHLKLPAELTKNRRSDIAWLTPEAAELLLQHNPGGRVRGRVFGDMPTHQTLDVHLKRAGISKHDHLGRSASFHTLRRSLITLCHLNGVDRRTAMAIARHSHSDLTDNVYADLEALPKRDAIMRLPFFLKSTGARTEMRTEALDAGSDLESESDASDSEITPRKPLSGRGGRQKETGSVVTRQNPLKNGAGGNRTPVPESSAQRLYVCSHPFHLDLTPGDDALCFDPAA